MLKRKIPNVRFVVKHNLCLGCGICESICPSKAIKIIIKNNRFQPCIDQKKCNNDKGCHRCYDVCPGIGVNLEEFSTQKISDNEVVENSIVGKYLKCFTCCSSDNSLRENASSGGALTGLLLWLLDKQLIDGAIVTKFDKNEPLIVKSFIATSKEDILMSKGSKYAPVSFHRAISDLRKSKGNRYVIVGLPCHIHGVYKLMALDRKVKDKVIGLFSLFCSGTQTFNYTKYILHSFGCDLDKLSYLAYREGWPSGMVARGTGFNFSVEYQKYNVPLKSIFYPKRCLLCVDMFGELADISFGDIYVQNIKEEEKGIGALVVRNKKWMDMLMQMQNDKTIHLKEISLERLLYKRYMANVKKTRNASFVLLLQKLGLVVPKYDSQYNAHLSLSIIVRYFYMRFKQFLGNHKYLWFLLPKIK